MNTNIILTDDEILCAMWISQKFANENNKSFSGFLRQVLDIMIHDKKAQDKIQKKPEYYVKKINYSWVKREDKIDNSELSSNDMLMAIKLALIGSKNYNRPFPYVYDIALQLIKEQKANYDDKTKANL